MKIYEYQAKELFRSCGIPVPPGVVVRSPSEAVEAALAAGGDQFVIKAQIHAGGRGKAGGVHVVSDLNAVADVASRLLGSRLVTAQTGPEGLPVLALLIEPAVDVRQELYLAALVDRERACPVLIATAEGGTDVEHLATESPEKMKSEWIDPGVGLRPFQAVRLAFSLGLPSHLIRPCSDIIMNLYRFFVEKDCSHAEINPLVVTGQDTLIALDAKVVFDDNALFRHPEIGGLRDAFQEDALEVKASAYKLNYIKLKGNVGCMVNGAGLAMATMDLIKAAGGEPANFLDVGGGATDESIKQGFRILLCDRDVRLVFINIFGGILRCDTLARGVARAVGELQVDLPVVVRMEGTNVDQGRKVLADSGLKFYLATDMRDAAETIGRLLRRVS
ncbi:MAG TPA: ADP-forming succinate--CoA ligase subunit beta [Deltaproteobacteria bacterium]|nr:ADP-forming succinate--CoA ligase subunit beta [Deltaproteobacteria bacterium]